MKFTERFRKDRKFQIIIIAIAVVMLWASTGPEKKTWTAQATCNQYSNLGDSKAKSIQCEDAGCALVFSSFLDLKMSCKSCAEEGDKTTNPDRCCSGKSKQISGEGIIADIIGFRDYYLCTHNPDPPNEREAEIGKIVQDMGLFKTNTKTAYYVVIFGGGFLALMILGMMF